MGHASAQACDDACKLNAAEQYLSALVTHDARQVPFAPNARRIENGKNTGEGGEAMRVDLEKATRFRVISGIRDKNIFVAGDEVIAIYSIDTGKLGSIQLATARVFERFKVIDGLITQIEIVVITQAGRVPGPVWPE